MKHDMRKHDFGYQQPLNNRRHNIEEETNDSLISGIVNYTMQKIL